jgi:hypothetical protein
VNALAFVMILILASVAAMVIHGAWRFRGPKARRGPRVPDLWARKNSRAIRSPLPRRVIAERIGAYIAEPPDDADVWKSTGTIDRTIFRIEYRRKRSRYFGWSDRSRYVLSGRILNGSPDRLVVLRFARRPWPWWSITLGLFAGVSATKTGDGPWITFVPWRDEPALFARIVAMVLFLGVFLPLLGAIPIEVVDTATEKLRAELDGAVE